MAKIFITGSADGLGLLAGKALLAIGHQVVFHARNEDRAMQLQNEVPNASGVMIANLAWMDDIRKLAKAANAAGPFDAVIHNAGVYDVPANAKSEDGLPLVFAVNTIAPYMLTALMHAPKRLIYLSSGMHLQGDASISKLEAIAAGKHTPTYSDTKLHDLILAKAIASKWQGVQANAIDPGWVPTKMGGASAPDNLEAGYATQVWLADGNADDINGAYLHHKKVQYHNPQADDIAIQEKLLEVCARLTGIALR